MKLNAFRKVTAIDQQMIIPEIRTTISCNHGECLLWAVIIFFKGLDCRDLTIERTTGDFFDILIEDFIFIKDHPYLKKVF